MKNNVKHFDEDSLSVSKARRAFLREFWANHDEFVVRYGEDASVFSGKRTFDGVQYRMVVRRVSVVWPVWALWAVGILGFLCGYVLGYLILIRI